MRFSPSTVFGQISRLFLLTLLAAALTAFLHPKPPVWQENLLKPGEVHLESIREWNEILWIDARTETEFESGHLSGALLLNEENWNEQLFDFFETFMENPERPIVVYCDGTQCDRSTKVAERLRIELENADVFVLKGDWRKWE